jgi:hypothetical protein
MFLKLVRASLGHAKQVTSAGLSFDPFSKLPPQCSAEESREVGAALLAKFLGPSEYQFGRTKVFLRNGATELLLSHEEDFFGANVRTDLCKLPSPPRDT